FVEVVLFVSRRKLNPDASIAFCHYGIEKSDDVNSLVQKFHCEFLREFRFIQHDGNNWMLPGFNIKPCFGYPLSEIFCILEKFVAQRSGLRKHVEYSNGSTDNG